MSTDDVLLGLEIALFVVTAEGDLRVASAGKPPPVKAGDRVIALAGAP